jgi:hypothetical protein
MGTKLRFREKVIKDQVVFMGVGVDQELNRALSLEGLQFVRVTGGIDHHPRSAIYQDRIAERVPASPDEFDWAIGKIKQGSSLFIHSWNGRRLKKYDRGTSSIWSAPLPDLLNLVLNNHSTVAMDQLAGDI